MTKKTLTELWGDKRSADLNGNVFGEMDIDEQIEAALPLYEAAMRWAEVLDEWDVFTATFSRPLAWHEPAAARGESFYQRQREFSQECDAARAAYHEARRAGGAA